MKRLALVTLLLLVLGADLAPWQLGVGGNAASPIATAAANETRPRPPERPRRTREAERTAADTRVSKAERSESAATGSFRDQRRLPEAFERSELYKWEYGKFDGRTLRNSVPDRPDLDTIRDHLRTRARLEGDSGGSRSVSMYNDLPTAERAIDTVLRQNRAEIEQWLQNGKQEQLELSGKFAGPVGVELYIPTGHVFPVSRNTVILRRTAGGRFTLLDSYPTSRAPETRPGGYDPIASHEAYKDSLRAEMRRPEVSDAELAKLMKKLYRDAATIGSGSTAAAVRAEAETGKPVQQWFHAQKAADGIRALERWLRAHPEASPADRATAEHAMREMRNAEDRAAAEHVIRDMRNALEGR